MHAKISVGLIVIALGGCAAQSGPLSPPNILPDAISVRPFRSNIQPGYVYAVVSNPRFGGYSLSPICYDDFKSVENLKVISREVGGQYGTLNLNGSSKIEAGVTGLNFAPVTASLGASANDQVKIEVTDAYEVRSVPEDAAGIVESYINKMRPAVRPGGARNCRKIVDDHLRAGRRVIIADRVIEATKAKIYINEVAKADVNIGFTPANLPAIKAAGETGGSRTNEIAQPAAVAVVPGRDLGRAR